MGRVCAVGGLGCSGRTSATALEDEGAIGLVDAVPLVFHRQLDLERIVGPLDRRGDPYDAAPGHRIASVHDQVDEGALDLQRVDTHLRQLERQLGLEPHLVPDQPVHQGHRRAHELVRMHDLERELGLATERQQALREARGGGQRAMGVVQLASRTDALRQQLEVGVDHGEQVVEVVGDARGQAPDRFHLLGVGQLFTHPHLVAHVEHRAA